MGGSVIRFDIATQVISTIATFSGLNGLTPLGDLVRDATGNFYGTTSLGGAYGKGTIFRIDPTTSQLTTIVSFNGANGEGPSAGLVADSYGNFYGTTEKGGVSSGGTIFKLDSTGALSTLKSFDPSVGAFPGLSELIFDAGGNLYGTTSAGANGGSIVRLNPTTLAFDTLATFGNYPGIYAPLIFDAQGSLFGTTYFGGTFGYGSIFRLDVATGQLTTVATFDNANGQYPLGGMTFDSQGMLLGTTQFGGQFNMGSIFSFDPSTNQISTLHSFDGTSGGGPVAGLSSDGHGNFFGVTTFGGSLYSASPYNLAYGTIFKISTTVPEPSAFMLLLGAVAAGVLARSRHSSTKINRQAKGTKLSAMSLGAGQIVSVVLVTLIASPSSASIIFGPDFTSYAATNLGSPSGFPTPAGGLTLLAGDSNTLLIGGNANTPSGALYSIGLTRDANHHITGFTGTTSLYASAPYIDGGLAYGPGGVLFYTRYNLHQLGQIEPSSAATDRVDTITGFGAPGNSVGSLAFVPNGFGSTGTLKISTYQQGQFGTLPLTSDGSGTYSPGPAVLEATLSGGPEGIAYVVAGSAGFAVNSILVAEYNNGTIAAYDVDVSDNPILATRREFLTGLTGAEGAFIDPMTGDFLFSTFMAGSEVFVVQGFTPPDTITAEPTSMTIWLGMTFAESTSRIRRRLSDRSGNSAD